MQVLQYQNQCKKLPKALRDWQAFVDCRDTIDNFLEMLPLFQALAHKSMRERHWKAVMDCTGVDVCEGGVEGAEDGWHEPVTQQKEGGWTGWLAESHVPAALLLQGGFEEAVTLCQCNLVTGALMWCHMTSWTDASCAVLLQARS